MHWYHIPQPETTWLVDGLIPSDGHVLICGKPKAGKSTLIRNLIVAVIKDRKFLDRTIDIPAGTGRVLYIHLDRKDQPWRVTKELKELGVTQEESSRLTLRTAQDLPSTVLEERLEWLRKEIVTHTPNLVVIDLLWQFVSGDNNNDYQKTLQGINQLQDALTETKYTGALLVALHSRKANNADDPADDILGSTSQRGSFVTNILMKRHRNQDVYTIMTEQTVRDDVYGEIDETIINRNPDGTLSLGRSMRELAKEETKVKSEADLQRLLVFIDQNPGCEMENIMTGLSMSKKKILDVIGKTTLVRTTGNGIKGDPHKYFSCDKKDAQSETQALVSWAAR